MRRLAIIILGLAFITSCFAVTQSASKSDQKDWLEGQNDMLAKQLSESDGFWLAGQNELLLEHLESQLESNNGLPGLRD